MKTKGKSKINQSGMSCVRMSPTEYQQIQKESEASGKSIPKLLRDSYFGKPPVRVLMNQKDVAILRKDLSRIGNNLNQIARKLNAGLMHGWSDSLDLVLEQFKTLTDQIYYGYGVH